LGEARFTFAHELIRQTLVSGLSLPRRQRLHLRVAETMEQVYGKDAELYASDLAHHLYQAGAAADLTKTARYLVLAGDRALEGAAFAEALRNYDIAFPLLPAGDREGRANLVYKRGLARRSLGRWDEALADWREAAKAFERLGDTEATARTYDDMSLQLVWGARWEEVLEMSQRGLAALGRRQSANRPSLLGYGALTLSFGGHYSAGDSMYRRALIMAEKLGDDGILGHDLTGLSAHHWAYMQWREAAEAALRGAPLLRRAGNLWLLITNLEIMYSALLFVGQLDSAAEVWRELQPLATRLGRLLPWGESRESAAAELLRMEDAGALELAWQKRLEAALSLEDAFSTTIAQVSLGALYFWQGRWQEALDRFEKGAEGEHGGAWEVAQPFVLLAWAYMGNRPAVLAILSRRAVSRAGQQRGRPAASLLLPMMRAARNSGLGLTGLLRIIRETRSMRTQRPLPRAGRPNTIAAWTMLFAAVEGLAVLGEKAEAAKLYPLVLEAMKAGTFFRPYDLRLIDTLAGIAAGAGRKWAEAEEHFRTALRRAEELPHVIEQPEARRWYARMLIDRDGPGDRAKARELLTEAIAMYREIGMPKHVEMAEALLREL
jgi:tetratricopeptide (TPR) repeat protein